MITFIRICMPACIVITLATASQELELTLSHPRFTLPVPMSKNPQRSWGEYFSSFSRASRKPTAREIDYTQAYAPRSQATRTQRHTELISAYENAPQKERELTYEGKKRDYERTVRRAEVRNQKLEHDIKKHEEVLFRTERNALKQLMEAQSAHAQEWLTQKKVKDQALTSASQELKQAEEEYLIKGAGIKEAQRAYKEAVNLALQKEVQAERNYEKYLQKLKNRANLKNKENIIPQVTGPSVIQTLTDIEKNQKKLANAHKQHALTTQNYKQAIQKQTKSLASQRRPYSSYTFQELVKQRLDK